MSQPNLEFSQPGCSIAIKCADDPLIERCLDSIDDPSVSVNAVITPSSRIESLLQERDIPYVVTEYGNIARSAQLSVDEAEHDRVIIMDSDAYFAPGAIEGLRRALHDAVVAKPRLEFKHKGTHLSRLIAESRRAYNAIPDHATNPGLAIRRQELKEQCGYIFNPYIRWTEDTDLNYRMHVNGVPIAYVQDAVLYHDAVTLSHEMKCAFLYGIGKRLSVEHTPGRLPSEDFSMVLRGLLKADIFERIKRTVDAQGLERALLSSAWRAVYLAGYHAQKHTGHWTLDK